MPLEPRPHRRGIALAVAAVAITAFPATAAADASPQAGVATAAADPAPQAGVATAAERSALPLAGAANRAARAETVACARYRRAARSSSGARQRKARRQLQACNRQNRANRQALAQLRNGRYSGVRGDGASIDHLLCANGRYELRTTRGSIRGVNPGTSWTVSDAVVRNRGRWINAIVRDRPKGMSIALARRGQQWQVGIVSFSTRIGELGPVQRTAAGAEC